MVVQKGLDLTKYFLFALYRFCTALEAACVDSVDNGNMTKDLAICIHGMKNVKEGMFLHTEDFMLAVEEDMKKNFAQL